MRAMIEKYGPLAVGIYLGLFFIVLFGFAMAIQFGFQVESMAGGLGTWAAAYIATKLTQPLRIIATIALVPWVAKLRG